MLAIRMKRVGRSGHAQFRMVVQDSRFHPSSGRVVAYLGSYNPHSKESQLDKDKLKSYLASGAQPSPRVVKILKQEKVSLPTWVNKPSPKKKTTKNPDKRRSTRPEEPAPEKPVKEEAAAEAAPEAAAPEAEQAAVPEAAEPVETPAADEPAEQSAKKPAQPAEEKPAE